MAETLNLPVLPLADEVVLPGMVAPIALDGERVVLRQTAEATT